MVSQNEVSGLPSTFYKHITLCSSGCINCDLEVFPATGWEAKLLSCLGMLPNLAPCWTGRMKNAVKHLSTDEPSNSELPYSLK